MAERVFTNGKIITMESRMPTAEALLVRGNTISAVGSIDEISNAAGVDAVWHDLQGKAVIPGFNDNHIHAMQLGLRETSPTLLDLTPEEIVNELEAYRAANPDSPYLIGYGWDYPHCPSPHMSFLDQYFPDIPVFLFQFSGHAMWTNTRGFNAMGLSRNRRNRKEEVMTDESGLPTGIVREAGSNPYVRSQFKKQMVDPGIIKTGLLRALTGLARAGITSVQDNTWVKKPVQVLRELKNEGMLTCRFSCWPLGEVPFLSTWVGTADFDDDWFHLGPVKYFLDGAFSSHNAWLYEAYADEPGNSGSGRPANEIVKRLLPRVRQKRQVAHHAIGDRAISEFCDAVEIVRKKCPWVGELRLRIEHGQLIRSEDIPRLKDLGICICSQPAALIDPEKDRNILGEERARRAYPYRSLLDAGVALSFGSDFPGEAFFDPIRGIHLAVNREGPERITAGEALDCYTRGSAYAEFKEDSKGSIRAGKLADLAILSDSIIDVPEDQISSVRVVETIVGGKTVYQSAAG